MYYKIIEEEGSNKTLAKIKYRLKKSDVYEKVFKYLERWQSTYWSNESIEGMFGGIFERYRYRTKELQFQVLLDKGLCPYMINDIFPKLLWEGEEGEERNEKAGGKKIKKNKTLKKYKNKKKLKKMQTKSKSANKKNDKKKKNK